MQAIFHNLISQTSGLGPWIFLNAGQSNDEKGTILTSDLVSPYVGSFPQVKYYEVGATFSSLDSTDQDTYQAPLNGATLNIANQFYLYPRLADALGCDSSFPLYVISYSVGDTDLAVDWKSTTTVGALYTAMINRIVAGIAAVAALWPTRSAPRIFCFLWDQGEKDARDFTKTSSYPTNMQNFIDNVRSASGYADLKFYMPLISQMSINGSPNPVGLGSTVNLAKRNISLSDPLCKTQDCNYFEPASDGVHFTAGGQEDKNSGQLQDFINFGWLGGTAIVPPSDMQYFNGDSSYSWFGDILDTLFAVNDTAFRLSVTVWNPPGYGFRTLVAKFASTGDNRTFHWFYDGSTNVISFAYYMTTGNTANVRRINWTLPSILGDVETVLQLRYDGSIDTGLGLDRVSLYVNGVLYTTGKTLSVNTGTLSGTLFNGTASLAVGAIVNGDGSKVGNNFFGGGWFKDFIVENGTPTTIINVPDLGTGVDTSGNGHNGTAVYL